MWAMMDSDPKRWRTGKESTTAASGHSLERDPRLWCCKGISSEIQQAELRKKSEEYKNKAGRVLARKVLHRRRTPEICRVPI